MKRSLLSIATLAVLLSLPETALAYLDPGTGSMLLQGLIALIGGVMATIGIYWRALMGFLHRLLDRNPDPRSGADRDE